MTLSMTELAKATSTATGKTFDDIMKDVNAGDVIHCVSGVSGSSFFTTGVDYSVIMGTSMYSMGQPTIEDNDGCEVPSLVHMPFRKPLPDLFVKVESAPVELVVMDEAKAVPTPKHDPELVEWAVKGMESELNDLNESWMSFNDKKVALNKRDSDAVMFGDMTREQKAELLLAHFDGKPIQFSRDSLFSTTWITLVSDPQWDADVFYRVEPEALAGINAELKDISAQYNKLEEKMHDLLPEEEDDCWFW